MHYRGENSQSSSRDSSLRSFSLLSVTKLFSRALSAIVPSLVSSCVTRACRPSQISRVVLDFLFDLSLSLFPASVRRKWETDRTFPLSERMRKISRAHMLAVNAPEIEESEDMEAWLFAHSLQNASANGLHTTWWKFRLIRETISSTSKKWQARKKKSVALKLASS